jgi:CBS domain-containing protein
VGLLEYTIRVIEETASLGPITDFNVQLEQSERFSATRVIEVMGAEILSVTYHILHVIIVPPHETLSDISARDPLWSVYVDDPYSTVLDILSRHGLHRVLVTDSATGNPVCIVTQSAIVEMLANNAEEIFGPKMDETIGKLFNAYTLVHKINQKTSALSAFKLMRSERVSAVAVVDDEDRLVGSLSVKDLREVSIQEAMLDRLLLPIPQFLSKVHTETQVHRNVASSTSPDEFADGLLPLSLLTINPGSCTSNSLHT